MWSQGMELELVGGNDRDRFVPTIREPSSRAVGTEWAASESSSLSQTLACSTGDESPVPGIAADGI